MSWRNRAACWSDDPAAVEMFFLPEFTAYAIHVCGSCPVAEECGAEALERERGLASWERFGIFGGLRPRQRWHLDQASHEGDETEGAA